MARMQTESRQKAFVAPPAYLKPISNTRISTLKPLVLAEIKEKLSEKENFTRDHILYFNSLRQFSIAYRIALVGAVVKALVYERKLIKFNKIELGLYTPENVRKLKMLEKNPEKSFAGRYTTLAADELLNSSTEIPKNFNSKWLASHLMCIRNLADSTRYIYVRRIVEDLVRRGVLLEHDGFEYSLFIN